MNIVVLRVSAVSNKTIVSFRSDFGFANGTWLGHLPEVDREYPVEFNLDDNLAWGSDIIQINVDEDSIGTENGRTFFIGELESIDEDGYTVLRMGLNIVPFTTVGDHFPLGEHIKVLTSNLEIYPY